MSATRLCIAVPRINDHVDSSSSVPVSKLPQLVYETQKDIKSAGLLSTIVGHVGDGNFHALILFKTDEEMALAKELVHRMVKRAIALDGTCMHMFSLCNLHGLR